LEPSCFIATDGQTDRKTERHKQINKYIHKCIPTDRQTDRKTESYDESNYRFSQCFVPVYKPQNKNGETGIDKYLAKQRNKLFTAEIRRHQGSREQPTGYVLNTQAQGRNRNNNQRKFRTSGRAEFITSRAKKDVTRQVKDERTDE
jgi:hypothetical protein